MPRYKPGQSGNPSGKPKGSKSKWSTLREGLAEHVPEILDSLVEQAKAGDTQAIKLLLERTLPPLRAVDTPIAVPRRSGADSLAEKGSAIVSRMLAGRLTPTEATSLLGALSSQGRIVETDELAKRVEALEQTMERRR